MIVTCEQCQTTYKVDERLLGRDGRKVRCMDCKHIWMQAPPIEEAPPPAPEPETAPEPAAEPDWMQEPKEDDFDLVSREKGQYFHEDEMQIPDGVKPAQTTPLPADFKIPAMDYRPLGMGAGQLGTFAFLALFFLTLSCLIVMKNTVVARAPAMAHFYQTVGIPLKAPGEGLSLSSMTAETRVDGEKRTLVVQAKVSNISDKPQPSPTLRVQLKGAYGAVLKKWEFSPDKHAQLAAGESVPLDLSFKDSPEDGKTVELRVIHR